MRRTTDKTEPNFHNDQASRAFPFPVGRRRVGVRVSVLLLSAHSSAACTEDGGWVPQLMTKHRGMTTRSTIRCEDGSVPELITSHDARNTAGLELRTMHRGNGFQN